MKSVRLLILPLLAAAFVSPLAAQLANKNPVVKAIEPSRVAYVNSNAFLDPATGIKQLVKVLQHLELEFAPQQTDLNLQTEKLRTMAAEIDKLRGAATPDAKAIEEKTQAALALRQEIQQKQQAAQQAFAQRQQETQGPVSEKLGQELRAFAKERGITMLFDLAKLGDALLDAQPEADLTADFIAYFNAKNP
jgi:Skp family chaperone for outer membrane proteins